MSEQKGAYKVVLTAVTATTAGGVLSLQNPEGADLIITGLVLDITTQATGSATVDAGVSGASVASADGLIDAGNVGAAVVVLSNVSEGGTNGKGAEKWPTDHYLTITASATLAGLVGNAYVTWVRE